MEKFILSLAIWSTFIGVSTFLVYFGINYLSDFHISGTNAFGLAILFRFLFSINNLYNIVQKKYEI